MKNQKHFTFMAMIAIIALVAVIGFSMAACSNGSTGGGSNNNNNNNNNNNGTPSFQLAAEYVSYDEAGNEYKLEMGEGSVSSSMFRAANTAKKGHSYKLTITSAEDGKKEESTGTVDDVESLQIGLQHNKSSAKIKVGLSKDENVDNYYMKSFDNDIPLDSGGKRDKPRDMAVYGGGGAWGMKNELGGDIHIQLGFGLIRGIVKEDGTAYIPDTFKGMPVTAIGNFAFFNNNEYWNKDLLKVEIPKGVTDIGAWAFKGCENLTSVTFASGSQLKTIGSDAFSFCSNLSSITIPSGVTEIYDNAFVGCTSLSAITIPTSITTIGDYAFNTCTSLSVITIPSSVTYIGDGAFIVWTSSQTIYIKGHANRQSTINAGWSDSWDKYYCEANIVYQP